MRSFISKLFITVVSFVPLYGQTGDVTSYEQDDRGIRTNYCSVWHIEEKQYTPGQVPEGVTFTYYDNCFTGTPSVLASVRKDDQGSDILASASVVSSTTADARVLVVVADGDPLTLSEADDTYYVTIYSMGL